MKHTASYKFLKKSSGQAVLLVILGMAVVLTIVLSVVSRSVTDVSISEVEENSSKAFSAAEAGIERLLIGETNISGEQLGNDAFIESAQSYTLGEGGNFFSFSDNYNNGDTATVWFVSHTDDGLRLTCTNKICFNGSSFTVFWNGNNTAVEVVVYYDTLGLSGAIASTPNFSGIRVKRFAFDPISSRRAVNGFAAASGGQNGYSFSSGSINISDLTRPLFAVIRVLYGYSSGLGVNVQGGVLPSQGKLLVSRGYSGGTVRQVEVADYYRTPLSVFEAGLVSSGDLSKQ